MANTSRTNEKRTENNWKLKPKYKSTQLRDEEHFTCGDLGFGFCLKPGGIPVRKFNLDTLQYEDELPDDSLVSKLVSLSNDDTVRLRSSSSPCLSTATCEISEEDRLMRWSNFPLLDGIPFGTSLRQQREIYALKMNEYQEKKKMFSDSAINRSNKLNSNTSLSVHQPDLLNAGNIQIKLQSATEEVEVLQCELEACKRQLDSKYRAIQILRSQSMLVNATQKKFVETSEVMKKSLEKEVNSLQFELDAKMSCVMLSEQTWGERFDRMCLENAALMATLQARSDELIKMHRDKMALVRERDELIARMDAKERLQYDTETKTSDNNSINRNEYITQQLAVLGACTCRGTKPEPCNCARAAAKLKKENQKLIAEVDRLNQDLSAAYLSSDAFRLAFEDQLDHNSTIHWHITQDSNRKKKSRRHRLPWRRKSTSSEKVAESTEDGDVANAEDVESSFSEESEVKDTGHDVRSIGVQATQAEPDIIKTLIELLNDRSQALAHQRLVARMLARRAQDLEKTMARTYKLTGSHEV